MCLYLREKEPIKKVAEKDIVCYKVLNARKNEPSEAYAYFNKNNAPKKHTDGLYYFTPFQYINVKFGKTLTAECKYPFFDNVDGDTFTFQCYEDYYHEGLTDEEKEEIKILNINDFLGTNFFENSEEEDVLTDLEMGKVKFAHSYINAGVFHTFANREDAEKIVSDSDDLYDYGIIMRNSGYADYTAIVECVIPKGSEYYEGVFETSGLKSYGSRQIRYRKVLKLIVN